MDIRDNLTISIPAWFFLKEQYITNKSNVRALRNLFYRYACGERLPTTIFHYINKENSIYQLKNGQLRIPCFIDGPKLILTHGFLKKDDKTPKREIDTAISTKEKYERWKGEKS